MLSRSVVTTPMSAQTYPASMNASQGTEADALAEHAVRVVQVEAEPEERSCSPQVGAVLEPAPELCLSGNRGLSPCRTVGEEGHDWHRGHRQVVGDAEPGSRRTGDARGRVQDGKPHRGAGEQPVLPMGGYSRPDWRSGDPSVC